MDTQLKRLFRLWKKRWGIGVYIFLALGLGLLALVLYSSCNCLHESHPAINDYLVNLLSTLLGLLIGFFILDVSSVVLARHEDEQKVCFDDKKMTDQYGDRYWHDFYLLNGGDKKARVHADCLFVMKKDTILEVKDNPKLADQFVLDTFFKVHCLDILSAHGNSIKEHSLTVRLKDVEKDNNVVTLTTHRSTYLAHLLTNRAIDYKIKDKVSIREVMENRSTLTSLKNSKLSNHIGVNVLVFLEGRKYILLPKREKNGTIAKNQITASYANRLKMDNYDVPLSAEYVRDGWITGHLSDFAEALMVRSIDAAQLSVQFIGATRDIYEGGKPTFFYVVDWGISAKDYLSARSRFKPKKEKKGIDNAEEMFVVDWSSLTEDEKREKIHFHTFEGRNKTFSCEKNLLAGLYVFAEFIKETLFAENTSVKILEKFCESKNGNLNDCEDMIVENSHYLAVIDGTTGKTDARIGKKTGGRVAAEAIAAELNKSDLKPDAEPSDVVSRIQASLKSIADNLPEEQRGVRLSASAVIFSIARGEIWTVGDCQFLLNGKRYGFEKKSDAVLSEARALAIHMYLCAGKTEDELKANDLGRAAILDMLKMQHYLENARDEYGFSVFNATGATPSVTVTPVPLGSVVVLASDGYPELLPTLEKSENRLARILKEDPICYQRNKSTKGVSGKQNSYDDRSYIRFVYTPSSKQA